MSKYSTFARSGARAGGHSTAETNPRKNVIDECGSRSGALAAEVQNSPSLLLCLRDLPGGGGVVFLLFCCIRFCLFLSGLFLGCFRRFITHSAKGKVHCNQCQSSVIRVTHLLRYSGWRFHRCRVQHRSSPKRDERPLENDPRFVGKAD
jgi:hypothetical protein